MFWMRLTMPIEAHDVCDIVTGGEIAYQPKACGGGRALPSWVCIVQEVAAGLNKARWCLFAWYVRGIPDGARYMAAS
jgi:hypothetical protein